MYDDGPNPAVTMSVPSLPTGYDVTKHVIVWRSGCHITVGFDRTRAHIPRFLVQLHYQVQAPTDAFEWRAIARMDHNELSTFGHDVYLEGLHVDVTRRTKPTVHLEILHETLPRSRGRVIRGCVDYFREHVDYFVDVYEERFGPGIPPKWSLDGGDRSRRLIVFEEVQVGMSPGPAGEEVLTPWELSELLAEVEGTTPEAIERGAAALDLAPPWEAEVVEE